MRTSNQTGEDITWDGRETFHAFKTRIKRAVDLYEDPAVVKSEYFFRFRAALPKEYQLVTQGSHMVSGTRCPDRSDQLK